MAEDNQQTGATSTKKAATKKAAAKKPAKQAKEGLTPIVNGKKTFELSDGRICVIREGDGKDAEEATAASAGNRKAYMSALMAQCITIDGKAIVMEDLPRLKLRDYLLIQGEFSDLNF